MTEETNTITEENNNAAKEVKQNDWKTLTRKTRRAWL